MKSYLVILTFAFNLYISNAQVPIGQWQDYLSYNKVHSIEKVNNKIYAATDVGLFSYDTEEYILQKINIINRLSEVEVSAIAAIPNTDKLFVGYANGNIDIVSSETTRNIPDLHLKDMSNSKRINHVYLIDNKAYCATDFGIVVVDIVKNEIADTYIIGTNATNLKINQITTNNDSIYVASEKGVLGAPINSNTLSFYDTWKLVSNDNTEYLSVVSVNNKLIASKKNNNAADVMSYYNGSWHFIKTHYNFINTQGINSKIAIITSNSINLYDDNLDLIESIDKYVIEGENLTPSFSSILIDENNNKWIGDFFNGLVQIKNAGDTQIIPDGPSSNLCFRVLATKDAVMVAAGSYKFTSPIPAEFSILRNNKWKQFNSRTEETFKNKYNICDIAVNPRDENQIFLASCRNGIFELNNDVVTNLYDESNSAIERVYVWELVGGLAFDNDGNLFANNQEVNPTILVKPFGVKDNASEWYSYDYMPFKFIDGTPNNGAKSWLRQMIYTSSGHFWAISIFDNPGIFVFNTNNTIENSSDDEYRSPTQGFDDSRHRKIELWDPDEGIYNLAPYCLAEDNDGSIWVGTNSGVIVYTIPRNIFTDDKPSASRIKVARNDNSGLADYLLEDQKITCIAVDGANRKWIGTDGNGAYLISSDGKQTIHSFKSSNSSLLSDRINSISINPKNGEVFIATSKGLISYRGTATIGEKSFSEIYAFPNPVHPNFEGVITIRGLMENSLVKITDISGKIVYEANSTGGQLVWDGKNVYGEKVQSGVYQVFVNNTDGNKSGSTKIMIIK